MSRNNVLGSLSAIMPQFPSWAWQGLLGGSYGIDYGHESFHDANVVLDDPGQRGQAAGSAGGIADNLEKVFILLMVHTHPKLQGIGRMGRDVDLLGPSFK